VLVQDWYKDQQSQARVKAAIERALDLTLPQSYDRAAFQQARDKAYGLIFERASQGVAWVN
jgi:type I restriction enzyme, R subunit